MNPDSIKERAAELHRKYQNIQGGVPYFELCDFILQERKAAYKEGQESRLLYKSDKKIRAEAIKEVLEEIAKGEGWEQTRDHYAVKFGLEPIYDHTNGCTCKGELVKAKLQEDTERKCPLCSSPLLPKASKFGSDMCSNEDCPYDTS